MSRIFALDSKLNKDYLNWEMFSVDIETSL
jgi:hypothetical protein